jgi:hypothetical protein
LDPRLQLTDASAQSRRLAVNGVLQALHELLQVRDPRLERTQLVLPGTPRRGPPALICAGENAPKLPEPSDRTLTIAHAHR